MSVHRIQAALTAIAAISLFDNDIRRFLASPASFSLPLPSSSTQSQPSNLDGTHTPPTTTNNNNNSATPSNTTATSSSSSNLPFLPLIHTALHHRHVGTRYAACQCVRALSRGVAVLRTNIVDSGLGMRVFGVFNRGVRVSVGVGEAGGEEEEKRGSAGAELGKEGEEVEEVEDRRVLGAALAAVCNIVNEFSPLRPVCLSFPPFSFPPSLTVY
jgi:hypothetical protein